MHHFTDHLMLPFKSPGGQLSGMTILKARSICQLECSHELALDLYI